MRKTPITRPSLEHHPRPKEDQANDRQIDHYLERVHQIIDKHGWFVQQVLAEEGHLAFAYSVGAPTQGLPEIIITGIPANIGAHLINSLLRDLAAGTPLTEAVPYAIANFPLYLRRLTPEQVETRMLFCAAFNEADFSAYQLVYPDPKGRFPWDTGYDFPSQELLFAIGGL